MRREFLLINGVTVDEYMEEAVKWLRSMKNEEQLVDGRCLAIELSEEEQKELSDYVYEIAYKEMMKTAGRHCLCKCDFGEYSEDLFGNFAVVLMNRLHTFNDAECLKNKNKKYRFSTFLDELSKDAIRMTYAQKRGVSEHVEQRIQNVRQATRKIMATKGLKYSEVTPKMIARELARYTTPEEVEDLLNISGVKISIEQRNEEDGVEKVAMENSSYINTSIFDVLDYDTEKLFDAFFSKLSDIEKFFILIYVGCSPLHDKMTLNQLSADELLVTIVERSKKFNKNICVGTVVIPRPYTSRTAEAVILEDVKYVNDSLIRYQRAQAKKTLMTLKSGLGFDDIAGKCGVAYFMHQWELLKRKYEE